MKYVAPLRDDEIQTLHDLHRYHPSRRARMRAHSLLLSHQGYSRLVKKLMRPRARSTARARRAVLGSESGLYASRLLLEWGRVRYCLCPDDCAHDDNGPRTL